MSRISRMNGVGTEAKCGKGCTPLGVALVKGHAVMGAKLLAAKALGGEDGQVRAGAAPIQEPASC